MRPNGWIADREEQLDRTLWAKEILAEECGGIFDALWDSLNVATNQLAVVSTFSLGELHLGQWTVRQDLPHGIQIFTSTNSGPALRPREWRAFFKTRNGMAGD